MIRAVLFDKDGTLVDFDRTWGPAAFGVMKHLAAGDRARLEGLMRVSEYVEQEHRFLPSSPLLAGASSHYGPLWAEVLGRPANMAFFAEMDRLFLAEGLVHLAPIGDPLPIMSALSARGHAIGIATNDAEASAVAQIARLGLTSFMRFIAGYDSGHGAKPGPGQVLAFAREVGVAPHEVALVGDTLHDLNAARAAGAVGVAVLTGPRGLAARAELAPHADHVIEDLTALLDLF